MHLRNAYVRSVSMQQQKQERLSNNTALQLNRSVQLRLLNVQCPCHTRQRDGNTRNH